MALASCGVPNYNFLTGVGCSACSEVLNSEKLTGSPLASFAIRILPHGSVSHSAASVAAFRAMPTLCVQVMGYFFYENRLLPRSVLACIIFVCVCGCMDTPGRVELRRRADKPPLTASAIVVPHYAGGNLWCTERRASRGSEERKESHGSQTVQAHQPGSALPDGF